MAYKPEHVVDLETGAIIAAEVHAADVADTASLENSLESARKNVLSTVVRAERERKRKGEADDESPPRPAGSATGACDDDKVELVADKGYHKAALLSRLGDAGFRTYIPERLQKGKRHWADKGGSKTAHAFYANRIRVGRKKSKALHRRRGELLERTFAHVCETGAHRRTRLRGLSNMKKRYLLQTAAANMGLVMRTAFGYGTPREMANRARAVVCCLIALTVALKRVVRTEMAEVTSRELTIRNSAPVALRPGFSTGC